jgi:hypothetical protein
MGTPENKQDDLAAFQSGPLENLTIQDGLIICAVYAVQTKTEKCSQISALAQKHPLFVEEPESTLTRVNKFTNLMQSGKIPEAVEAVALNLNTEQRKQAFEFAIEAALTDEVLTEKKQKTLQTLATELAIDNEFVDQKLTTTKGKARQ